jgi:hypothetical protein
LDQGQTDQQAKGMAVAANQEDRKIASPDDALIKLQKATM